MGVTLERVQNKFACIIGELCSEPDILSEFAIWLDLRLAEYKAKGAIQLECSGETPDPTWLRGHKKPPKRIKSDQIQRLHHFDPASQYNEDTPQDISERLSPDILVVKEELGEGNNDVFPVSIHRHDISAPNRNHARKRSSADGGSIKHSDENSAFKIQRLSPSTPVLEPVNQSLMSIISENTADESGDMTGEVTADFSTLDSSNIDNSSYIHSPNPVASTSGGDGADQQDVSNSVRLGIIDGWSEYFLGPHDIQQAFTLLNAKPRSYRNYAEKDMNMALERVASGTLTSREAAKIYNVPKTTLLRKLRTAKALKMAMQIYPNDLSLPTFVGQPVSTQTISEDSENDKLPENTGEAT